MQKKVKKNQNKEKMINKRQKVCNLAQTKTMKWQQI